MFCKLAFSAALLLVASYINVEAACTTTYVTNAGQMGNDAITSTYYLVPTIHTAQGCKDACTAQSNCTHADFSTWDQGNCYLGFGSYTPRVWSIGTLFVKNVTCTDPRCQWAACPSSTTVPPNGNLALNKPTCQSSTYTGDWGTLVARLAADGDTRTDPSTGACTHTQQGNAINLSWWVVDLCQERTIDHVVIYGRSDTAYPEYQRLKQFNVGITNVDPNVVEPKPGNYHVCAYSATYPNPPAARLSLTCSATANRGRYVIVQFATVSDYLTICELEVYASA